MRKALYVSKISMIILKPHSKAPSIMVMRLFKLYVPMMIWAITYMTKLLSAFRKEHVVASNHFNTYSSMVISTSHPGLIKWLTSSISFVVA